jgi:hypothetical protein
MFPVIAKTPINRLPAHLQKQTLQFKPFRADDRAETAQAALE